ncbi:hypothetical protein [Butyricicoccus pullicaecorum]|uniref:hypothetical protein n=1 Tax=Butyricicoccus pullicaecorum TaxID=501571 RepID=UPI001951A623|nr:hypothetical protein [Butyricicoccus pullicaecorum]
MLRWRRFIADFDLAKDHPHIMEAAMLRPYFAEWIHIERAIHSIPDWHIGYHKQNPKSNQADDHTEKPYHIKYNIIS